jgi:hypothetical protein
VDKRDTLPPRRAKEILDHYLANPQVADTFEGIAEWRLLEELVQRRVEETEAALRWLVSNGYLEKSTGAAAPPLYRLNPSRRPEAEQLMRATRKT